MFNTESVLGSKVNQRAEIMESNYTVPSKIMIISPGVELKEPAGGRHVKGDIIMMKNRLALTEYKRLTNTTFIQAQQA